MSTTIKDIAAELGISHQTVSRALNGHPYVREELREKVLATANRLNYRPNALARGLKGMRTKLVGLIIPDLTNDFYASAATIIQASLAEHGYRLLLCVSGFSISNELAYLQAMREERVEGLIWVPLNDNALVREYVAEGVPVLQFARMVTKELDAIVWDDGPAAEEATRHLLKLGHERIALIAGQKKLSSGRVRVAGYLRAMRDAGVEPSPELIKVGTFEREWGHLATSQLLALPDPPTAILAASGNLLEGALQATVAAGVNIPDDLSLVGYSNPHWYAIWRPPLTTVAFPTEVMAPKAVQMILSRIKGRTTEVKPKTTIDKLSCRLIIRGSTAPPRAGSLSRIANT